MSFFACCEECFLLMFWGLVIVGDISGRDGAGGDGGCVDVHGSKCVT